VVFQVPSGEEALLAVQMISPQQRAACRKRHTTPGFHNHRCKQKGDDQNAIGCDLQHAQRDQKVFLRMLRLQGYFATNGSKCTFPLALAVFIQERSEYRMSPYPH
jgi:hypothetical protein